MLAPLTLNAATGAVHFGLAGAKSYAEVTSAAPAPVPEVAFTNLTRGWFTEVVVDNRDAGTRRSGDWSEVAATKAFDGTQLTSTSRQNPTVTWLPRLPRAGYCAVAVRWSAVSGSAPANTNASYLITHADGTTTRTLDQSQNADQWVSLGTYRFRADGSDQVTLAGGTSGLTTLADAVRFSQPAFALSEHLTLEAWVKFDGPSLTNATHKWMPILGKGRAWGLALHDQDGVITFYTDEGGVLNHLTSPTPLLINQWYHVAAVWDGTRKSLYVAPADSTQPGIQSSGPFSGPLAQTAEPVRLGRSDVFGQSPRFLLGALDMVRIWSVPRRSEELTANRQALLRGSEAGLLGDWRFEPAGPTSPVVNRAARDPANASADALLRNVTATALEVGLDHAPPLDGELALRFARGAGASAAVAAVALPAMTNQFSIETWAKPGVLNSEQGAILISRGPNAWELGLDQAGHPFFAVRAGNTSVALTNTAPLLEDTWQHLAAVWDGTASPARARLYLDGALAVEGTFIPGTVAAGTNLTFGMRPAEPALGYGGLLDEVRLWRTALSPGWIEQHFRTEVASGSIGLVGNWRFNEGSGAVATNEVTSLPPANATLVQLSDADREAGFVLEPEDPASRQYTLYFNGADTYVEIPHSPALNLDSLTIEAWIKPDPNSGGRFRNLLMKGNLGYGLALDEENFLRYWNTDNKDTTLKSSLAVPLDNTWHHVAVTVDTARGLVTFYLDGNPAGTAPGRTVNNNAGPLILGRQGSEVATNYYRGYLDEVRVWGVARTGPQIAAFANTQLPDPATPGLLAYWNFNDGGGVTLADLSSALQPHNGTIKSSAATPSPPVWALGRDVSGSSVTPGVSLQPNPQARGLWVGTVTLNSVNEVQTATPSTPGRQTPTSDTASFRILLHVDDTGTVRLLKDVVVMAATTNLTGINVSPTDPVAALLTNQSTRIVLVTDPNRISSFQGVITRGGRKVGMRLGTIAYDFDGNELELTGGVGARYACAGRIELARTHPTNPFRHRYHPDHANVDPRNDPQSPQYDPNVPLHGFAIQRDLLVQFDAADPANNGQTAAGYGVDHLSGSYQETLTGLHKLPLITRGTISLSRVSEVTSINKP